MKLGPERKPGQIQPGGGDVLTKRPGTYVEACASHLFEQAAGQKMNLS